MCAKFRNKYRIESSRLVRWNYGWNASYFVTFCTKNRICFLGNVVKGAMILNDIGKIANNCWLEIPDRFPFVKLGNHMVMPNHVHGIIIIENQDMEWNNGDFGELMGGRNGERDDENDDKCNGERDVETRLIASLHLPLIPSIPSFPEIPSLPPIPSNVTNQRGGITGNKNPMLYENLSKIIRWFKGRTTFESRKIHPDFSWQPRFHDHIIRNHESFDRISHYILNNPRNWRWDRFSDLGNGGKTHVR